MFGKLRTGNKKTDVGYYFFVNRTIKIGTNKLQKC
jgi:hypothetical protein